MSLSRIIIFIIGIVLALFGLFIILNNWHDIVSFIIGLVILVIGIILLSGKTFVL